LEIYENCHVEWREFYHRNKKRKFFDHIHDHCRVELRGNKAIITLEDGSVVEQSIKKKGFMFKTMGTIKL